ARVPLGHPLEVGPDAPDVIAPRLSRHAVLDAPHDGARWYDRARGPSRQRRRPVDRRVRHGRGPRRQDRLYPRLHLELLEDVVDVDLQRLLADEESPRDLRAPEA